MDPVHKSQHAISVSCVDGLSVGLRGVEFDLRVEVDAETHIRLRRRTIDSLRVRSPTLPVAGRFAAPADGRQANRRATAC